MSNHAKKAGLAPQNLIEESGRMIRKLYTTDDNTATVILRLVLGGGLFRARRGRCWAGSEAGGFPPPWASLPA
jgi:hypothetical protein